MPNYNLKHVRCTSTVAHGLRSAGFKATQVCPQSVTFVCGSLRGKYNHVTRSLQVNDEPTRDVGSYDAAFRNLQRQFPQLSSVGA
jgi:hypothetical protein